MNDKLKKIIIGCGAGFFILLVILFVLSSCQNGTITYSKLETRMQNIAKNYFENHEDELPTNDKETNEYTLKQMVSNGDLDEVSELLGDESVKCEGGVTVTNNNGYYLYTTELDCGDKYTTKTLVDQIKEDSLTEEGHGLYEVGNEYIFKGQSDRINNNVKFNNEDYKIMGITSDGNIKLIKSKHENTAYSWDTNYNSTTNSTGINKFFQSNDRNSAIKDALTNIYEANFTETAKKYIATQTLCIGERSEDEIAIDGSVECTSTVSGQSIGLLAVYEPLRTSIDPECSGAATESCTNYNWLYDIAKGWTVTPVAGTENKVYKISNYELKASYVNYTSSIKINLTIDGKTNYTSGTGTEEDPYIIGENESD